MDKDKEPIVSLIPVRKTYMERTGERKDFERLEKHTTRVLSKLEDTSIITVSELSKKTGLSRFDIERVIVYSSTVSEIMKLRRKMITSAATDNMMDIVLDRKDPNNYQATKYILENFKNEMDSSVTPKTNIEAEFGKDADGNVSPIKITFSTKQ